MPPPEQESTEQLEHSKVRASPPKVVRDTNSKAWIVLAMTTGLVFGLGNTIFGTRCSQLGFWGGSLTGPTVLLLSIVYRLIEACLIKRRTGSFFDWDNSNYWKRSEPTSLPTDIESDNDYQTAATAEPAPKYVFNWQNFWIETMTQSVPVVVALFLVTYAFKFALLAEMNQGCIPSLFAVVGIYIAVLFYFCFDEKISVSKIIGLVLIVLCIAFLALDQKEEGSGVNEYSASEKRIFGLLAVFCGLCAPLFWTFKGYFLRRTIDHGLFTSTKDLAIDSQFYQGICLTLLFFIYIADNDLDMRTFVEGQVTGVFFFIGGIVSPMAYDTGPGGPINALVNTSIVYQTVLAAIFFGQALTAFQIIGIGFGIAASLMITMCDDILERFCLKKKQNRLDQEAQLIGKNNQNEAHLLK